MKKQWKRFWFYTRRLVATWWTMLRRFAAKPRGQIALVLIVSGAIAAGALIWLISQIPIYPNKDRSGELSVNLAQSTASAPAVSIKDSSPVSQSGAYSARSASSKSPSSFTNTAPVSSKQAVSETGGSTSSQPSSSSPGSSSESSSSEPSSSSSHSSSSSSSSSQDSSVPSSQAASTAALPGK